MNPAFILLVLLGAFLLWLLCSFLYVPLGRTVNRLLKDSHRAMNDGGKIDFMEEEKTLPLLLQNLLKKLRLKDGMESFQMLLVHLHQL